MAAGFIELLVVFWKDWGILALVLMSLAMQVILLITADIRRRKDSGVLKVVVWSAYLLADTTAIYALGRMSVTCTPWKEHQLMAFWAPFLLLHLGGQDNITAYSMEDNRLWLRHLQSFVIQVLATAYVLYESSIVARRTLLRPAAILICVVGVLKYGERVCALKLACTSNLSGKNYHRFVQIRAFNNIQLYTYDFRAHLLLDISKNLLNGPLPRVEDYRTRSYDWDEMYGVAEMQLSLMHDVLYTKAEMIHTWHGYCIRVFSLLATITALLLFRQFSEKDGYRRADVFTTYVLLAGAVFVEITSVLRAMFSTWLYGKLVRVTGACLYHLALIPLRFRNYALAKYEMWRGEAIRTKYWSGSMGQHNFINMCGHCKNSRWSKIARWMGREDWWNMLVYTSSVPVSPDLSKLLRKQMMLSTNSDTESLDHIKSSRGRAALKRRPGLYEELFWSVETKMDESILVWHVATHIYLSWYQKNHPGRPHHLAQVTQELSNYMMFLLAARPYMLPDNASRQSYIELCHFVTYLIDYSSEADLIRLIRRGSDPMTLVSARDVGNKLISKELETPDANMLELISQVWVELLCYAACRCKPESHARQLSNGGEITTVVTFLLEYVKRSILKFEPLQATSGDSMPDSTTEPGAEDVLSGGAIF